MKVTAMILAVLALSGLAAPVLAQCGGFECDNGASCLSTDKVQDGYVDCEDGTDEVCEGFYCADLSACIPKDELNNNYAACADGSDLAELTVAKCDDAGSCASAASASPSTRAGIVWSANGDC